MSLSSTKQKREGSGHKRKMENFMQITWFFALRGWKCGKNSYIFFDWERSEKQKKCTHDPPRAPSFSPFIQVSSFFCGRFRAVTESRKNLIKTNISHVYHWNYISSYSSGRSRVSECDIWRLRWGVLCAENRIQPEISEHISREWHCKKKLAERLSQLLISKKSQPETTTRCCWAVLTQILLTNFLFIFSALFMPHIFHHIMCGEETSVWKTKRSQQTSDLLTVTNGIREKMSFSSLKWMSKKSAESSKNMCGVFI